MRADSPEPLIRFPEGCRLARFILREKRFLVEAETFEGPVRVHCNNSGSMLGLLRPGADILISPAPNPRRSLPFTLELVRVGDCWAGVNTLVPNRLLRRAWEAGVLPEASGYDRFTGERRIGASRLDALLEGPSGPAWVEAKNVTLVEDEVAYFPDAATVRGQKHLRELSALARQGVRAACFYLIQRKDARCFAPADFIDPEYADAFRQAIMDGVEIWPYRADVSPDGIWLGTRLPVHRQALGCRTRAIHPR